MSQSEGNGTGSNNDQQQGQQQNPSPAQASADGAIAVESRTTVPMSSSMDHSKSNGGSTTGHGSAAVTLHVTGGPAPISATESGIRAGSMGQSQSQTDPDDESQATVTGLDETSDGDEYSGSQQSANTTHDPGKMFIGGLSWQTTAEGLRDYFCKFGEVNECMVMRDPTTKRARGFGFITFADPNTVEKVLEVPIHELDGKQIDPKVAFPKKTQPKMIVKTKKVFIGGLSANSTLEDIKGYFQQYGKIEDAMLMYDKATQRHRGFGFITFDDDDVSDKVCEIHFHEINGKMVECKKAQPKEVMLPVQINKSKAAAARNLYGLAPEQLLAYASCMPLPRLSPYGAHTAPGVIYPGMFNGFSPPSTFGLSPSGRSSVSNSAVPLSSAGSSGMVNPRDLAAAQLAAQQQAVYEAALAYAQLGGSGGGDFGFGAHHHHHHHQHAPGPPPHQSPQQSSFHHMSQLQHHHSQQQQQFSAQMSHHHSPQQVQHQQQHLHHAAAAFSHQLGGHHPPQPSMAAGPLNSPGIVNSPSFTKM